jgi:hypothetical protein
MGHKVALVEGARFPRNQVGESLSPGIRNLMDYLQAGHLLAEPAYLHGLPARVIWETKAAPPGVAPRGGCHGRPGPAGRGAPRAGGSPGIAPVSARCVYLLHSDRWPLARTDTQSGPAADGHLYPRCPGAPRRKHRATHLNRAAGGCGRGPLRRQPDSWPGYGTWTSCACRSELAGSCTTRQ